MKLYQRLIFHFLRFLDDLAPGWGNQPEPKEDYLTHSSFAFWMTHYYKEGRE